MFEKITQKGVLSGIVTVLSGVSSIIAALHGTPPDVLITITGILAGFLTTKASVDVEKE